MSLRIQTLHAVILSLLIITLLLYISYSTILDQIPLMENPRVSESHLKKITQSSEASQPYGETNDGVELLLSKVYSSESNSVNHHTSIRNQTSLITNGNIGTGEQLTSTKYVGGHRISNPNLCPNLGSDIKIVILITSAPYNYEARKAVRMTWGHYSHRKDVAIAFVVGSTMRTDVQIALKTESEVYGDIIQGTFVDSYENMTLKTLSMLEWQNNYCSRAHFLLKTDDDVFINVHKLLIFVEQVWNIPRTIYGRLAVKWVPNRNDTSKYYISPEQYYQNFFPNFTTGPAYLITTDCVQDLYQHTLEHIFVKLEDVFITGIISEALNISRINVEEFYNSRIIFDVCVVKNAISIHRVRYEDQFLFWTILMDLIECY